MLVRFRRLGAGNAPRSWFGAFIVSAELLRTVDDAIAVRPLCEIPSTGYHLNDSLVE
jgi:hypothetical protein